MTNTLTQKLKSAGRKAIFGGMTLLALVGPPIYAEEQREAPIAETINVPMKCYDHRIDCKIATIDYYSNKRTTNVSGAELNLEVTPAGLDFLQFWGSEDRRIEFQYNSNKRDISNRYNLREDVLGNSFKFWSYTTIYEDGNNSFDLKVNDYNSDGKLDYIEINNLITSVDKLTRMAHYTIYTLHLYRGPEHMKALKMEKFHPHMFLDRIIPEDEIGTIIDEGERGHVFTPNSSKKIQGIFGLLDKIYSGVFPSFNETWKKLQLQTPGEINVPIQDISKSYMQEIEELIKTDLSQLGREY